MGKHILLVPSAACRKFKVVKYIRMPELLDELDVTKGCGTLTKTAGDSGSPVSEGIYGLLYPV